MFCNRFIHLLLSVLQGVCIGSGIGGIKDIPVTGAILKKEVSAKDPLYRNRNKAQAHGAALHAILLKYDRFLLQQFCMQQILSCDMLRNIDCLKNCAQCCTFC